MSWSMSVPTVAREGFDAAVDAAVASPAPGSPEQAEDIAVAKEVLKTLFEKAIGLENKWVSGSASGHACEEDNPNSYSYDSVNVSISGQPEPKV